LGKCLSISEKKHLPAKKEAFITLKDHKPNFQDHPTCRLINPSKSEIGVISKHILDEINTSIINGTKINQWKNTSSVVRIYENRVKFGAKLAHLPGDESRQGGL